MKDKIVYRLALILSLAVLGGWLIGLSLSVSAQEPEPTSAGMLYLPLIFKSGPPPSATPIPIFTCAPQRLADIPVGNQPRGLAVDEARTRLYVANYAGASVSIIDGHSHTVIKTVTHFPAISAPTGIAYDSVSDTIWVANSGSDSSGNFFWLTPIDAANFTVGSMIPLGGEPGGVVFNPVDRQVYVSNLSDDTVSVISPTLGSVVNTIGVGQDPYNLAVHRGTGWVYVANFGSQSVSVLNAAGLVRPDIPLDYGSAEPFGIAVDDVLSNYVYVTTVKSYRIETIDIDNDHQLLPWHQLERLNGHGAPLRALALNMTLNTADGGHLWTTTSTSDMSDFTQVLLIPKGYVSGFNQPIPDDYDDPSGGGLLGAGIAVNTVIDRTYISLPASNAVRVFGDREGGCVKPFNSDSDIFIVSGSWG
jgi:YVTN family beta-propeller protein